jgi:hypothetical protein
MATYDLLPVYKTTYDFLLQIFQFSKTFTREYKYTIGQELKNETIRLISLGSWVRSPLPTQCSPMTDINQ